MKRSKRKAAKQSAETLKAQRLAHKQRLAKEREYNKLVTENSIAKNNSKSKINYDTLSVFQRTVARKTPKLLELDYKEPLKMLQQAIHCRDISDWKPKGKGKYSQFVSLANHVLAKYNTPKFLWSAFWEPQSDFLTGIVERIAKGESFSKMCQTGEFPLPFTKKQCHAFLSTTSDYTFMSGLRKVQVQTYGGNIHLHNAWMSKDIGKTLQTRTEEIFWDSVLAWFAKNPMLNPDQLGPLIDYISYRHREDNNFSMKGRSVLAMVRGMEEWHHDLQVVKELQQTNYLPSGFKAGNYELKKRINKNFVTQHWTIREILTSKELAAEGKAHKHCVYSYSWSMSNARVSIWSMSLEGEKMITVEVNNLGKVIRQARGSYNRPISTDEFKILQRWANDNGFQVDLGYW